MGAYQKFSKICRTQPAHIVIEDVSQAKMVLELRQKSEVRRLIPKYRKSSKKWLKEAAQM